MKKDNYSNIKSVLRDYLHSADVVGVYLFGSVAQKTADRYSDTDIYIITKHKPRHSRKNIQTKFGQFDILIDSIDDIKSYIHEEKFGVHRSVSHMIAKSKILTDKTGQLKMIQKLAVQNLKLRTKLSKSELLMHQYSIDDFWSDIQRDIAREDVIAFTLDSGLLIRNLLDFWLKLHGEFHRQPKEMTLVLRKMNPKFERLLIKFCSAHSMSAKGKYIPQMIDIVYAKAGGGLPDVWSI